MHIVMFMFYFWRYLHISKIVCYCDFKTQYFRCVQIICIFYKSVCTEITIFFHFFQTIASCDHQSTSGHLVRCPFSLLLAILPFSYDFSNKNICKLNILIALLSADRYIRLLQTYPFGLFR